MPRAGFTRAPDVDVELDRSDSIFLPGDTVSGSVIVNVANSFEGKSNYINIKLFGRSKVLIVRSNGEGGKDYYRGRAVFFEKSFFLDGPPVPQGDKERWRFSIEIPTRSVPGTYHHNDVWKVNSKFLNNQEMDITQHALPGVFYYKGHSFGERAESYVEYVLQVRLQPSQVPEDQPKAPTTIIPLAIRTRSSEKPMIYSECEQEIKSEVRVKTLKLLPQYATEELGFKNSFKSMFQPSKVPNYFFSLKINCPETIQLDNPSHFPFKLSVVPKPNPNGRMGIFDGNDMSKLPDVKITFFQLCLKMSTRMRARSLWKWDTGTEKHHDYPILPCLPPGMFGYVIPREENDTKRLSSYKHPDETNNFFPTHTNQYLDLGQLLGLRLSRTYSLCQGIQTDFKAKRPLWPSFKTYNIVLSYELKYCIRVTCAGEVETIEGKQRVEIIGQSEEQEQNIMVDEQGTKKGWRQLLEGADGVGDVLEFLGEVASEAV